MSTSNKSDLFPNEDIRRVHTGIITSDEIGVLDKEGPCHSFELFRNFGSQVTSTVSKPKSGESTQTLVATAGIGGATKERQR